MAQQDPSRTEAATPKRRGKAREKGSVAKSAEVAKLVTLAAGVIALDFYVSIIGDHLMTLFRWFFEGGLRMDPTQKNVETLLWHVGQELAIMILPVMAAVMILAYLSVRLQVGKLWTWKVFEFDIARHMNIMAGLKRLFVDVQTLIRLGKSILQAAIIGVAVYLVLEKEIPNMLPLYYQNAEFLAAYMLESGGRVIWYALAPMAGIAIFDLWHSRHEYDENLKMTKDEVKDERKQAEGDPVVKSKQKQKMLEFMQRRMLQQVPKADVVITNPTHYAVALKYDVSVAPAPMVVAKGVDRFALKIREVAQEHRVPIRENKPLAQALYKSVEVGEVIPEELYQAVAAVLAQVYKMKGKA